MGHKKLREEKNCLNCGHTVEERFCTHCGQENLEIHDSAFHLIIHYIQDMFHYDGKFWHTLKVLVLKPGQVAKEYMEGRRSQNLEPLRFYVFASTVFFLLLFYLVNSEKWSVHTDPKFNYNKRLYNLEQERKFLEGSPDTAYAVLLKKGVKVKLDSIRKIDNDTSRTGLPIKITIPASTDTSKIGWLEAWLDKRAEKRNDELSEKHEGDQNGILAEIGIEAFHKLPQLLFLSMPFFAFFLKLLYLRKRRNYVEHLIFSFYFFAYLFVVLSIYVLLIFVQTENKLVLNVLSYLSGGLTIYMYVYLLLAMKRFYGGRWRYLLLRYVLLVFLFISIFLILFILTLVGIYFF
ncbi:MAG: DUF3667 domain-containing protein [Saprospiraceae bacterium]|uniref:DUF3667 domain-containing protein n=1 Tax=Candidatus Opimibacter skivensis TaxID=2982028 RepID=A0A9D7SYN5_9BACT|nr:DUF3667 domain-containing protein [Candidatus Opimibacter skivensis]